MTRALINFYSPTHTLALYHHRDHSPAGLRDYFHILDFVRKRAWTPRFFQEWAVSIYGKTAISLERPRLFFDSWGILVDYTYLLTTEKFVYV
jgi:hypothetical protein